MAHGIKRACTNSGERKFMPINSNNVSNVVTLMSWLFVRNIVARISYPSVETGECKCSIVAKSLTHAFHVLGVLPAASETIC